MRKFQIAISSYLCIALTWNLIGSCSLQQRLHGWSRMVVKQFQDGRRPPIWKSIYRHISSEKSSDFHEILYTAVDFELDKHHVIKNEKVALELDWTDSEFDRTYFLLLLKPACCRHPIILHYSTDNQSSLQTSRHSRAYKPCQRWLNRLLTKIAALAMISQCRQTTYWPHARFTVITTRRPIIRNNE